MKEGDGDTRHFWVTTAKLNAQGDDMLAEAVQLEPSGEFTEVDLRPRQKWPDGPAYLAGPMRGCDQFGFPPFFAAEEQLKEEHATVGYNPARHDYELGFEFWKWKGTESIEETGFDYRPYMEHGCEYIRDHAAWVCVLPGWETSRGSAKEIRTAWAKGIPIVSYPDGTVLTSQDLISVMTTENSLCGPIPEAGWTMPSEAELREQFAQAIADTAAVPAVCTYTGPRGTGGAPTRPRTMPTSAEARKKVPLASGLTDYFPDALIAIASLSQYGNDQHNPGKPLHWDRSKSGDEADTLLRHFFERGGVDTDGVRHSAKLAWRALALLQKEIEAAEEPRREVDRQASRLGL